jgi:hypothetical protein
LLTAALLTAPFFAFALLAFSFLSLALLLSAALLSGGGRLARLVRIALCFHNTFRLLLTSNWSQRGLR